jgi:hypothetical protein
MGGRGSGGHNRSSLVTTNFEDGRNAAKSLGIGEPAVSLELGYERCKFSARTREPKQFVGSDCYARERSASVQNRVQPFGGRYPRLNVHGENARALGALTRQMPPERRDRAMHGVQRQP